jgi:DeoR/GlpR family transcriptional regulator of sugar metabolism
MAKQSGEERRSAILYALEQHNELPIEAFVQQFTVSAATIRNDLHHLAQHRLITRTHGGARAIRNREFELSLVARTQQQPDTKITIARYAARLINDGDTIFIDSSSTSFALVPFLGRRRNLTVVTNSLSVSQALIEYPAINVVICGGRIRHISQSVVDLHSIGLIQQLRITTGFFGAHGINIRTGLTDISREEADAKQIIHQQCRRTVALLDASKMNRIGQYPFIATNQIHTLISDFAADNTVIEALRNHGVHCFLAN